MKLVINMKLIKRRSKYENILTSSFLIILLEDIIYNIVSLYITIQIYISSNYFGMKNINSLHNFI